MIQLSEFTLVWGGDWSLYTRLTEAYLAEVYAPEEAAQGQAALRDTQQAAELIRKTCRTRDPYRILRIIQDGACVGMITCHYDEAGRCGSVSGLYVEPSRRRQGVGTQALALAEKRLKALGAQTVRLAQAAPAEAFFRRRGYAPDPQCPACLTRQLPAYHGAAAQLLYYTRQPLEEAIYAPKLADSLHLALIEDGACTPLLHNSGVLYARAVPGEMGVLHPYSLHRPWMTKLPDGRWAVVAERIECARAQDGSVVPDPASEDHVLFFTSDDLIHYTEEPLLHLSDPLAQEYQERRGHLPDLTGLELPEGCLPCGVMDIDEATAASLRTRFVTPVNVGNDVPEEVEAAGPSALRDVHALARYSDGSTVLKRVDWDLRAVDWTTPGRYAVEGRVHQDRYEFPTMWHKADPAMCRWQGRYYFISTNDLDGNHSLYIREADSIPGLITAQQSLILDTQTYAHLGNLLWAPELHIIGDRLYIFHAGTPGPFGQEQSHVMTLKPGGNPVKAADWEAPRRVIRADGSPLFDKGITLDMTVFWSAGRLYAAWSQRQFDPVDLGAWLYVAELDPAEPWRLLSEPQMLTAPEYGWENNHTFVAEGPFALYHGGRILLTYSGALVDSTYVVGMLSMADGADPLDPASWLKENYPLLTSRSVAGEFGPGHNAYVTDEDGLVWNTYHARPGVNGPRSSGVRRVHFNAEGFPVLDMTEALDLDPALAWVRTTVVVK